MSVYLLISKCCLAFCTHNKFTKTDVKMLHLFHKTNQQHCFSLKFYHKYKIQPKWENSASCIKKFIVEYKIEEVIKENLIIFTKSHHENK